MITWCSIIQYTSLSTTNRVSSYYWECVGSHCGQVSDCYSVINCNETWRTPDTWTWHGVVHYGIKIIKWFSPAQCEADNVSIYNNSVVFNCYTRNCCRYTCKYQYNITARYTMMTICMQTTKIVIRTSWLLCLIKHQTHINNYYYRAPDHFMSK